jgi:hypothetical protein
MQDVDLASYWNQLPVEWTKLHCLRRQLLSLLSFVQLLLQSSALHGNSHRLQPILFLTSKGGSIQLQHSFNPPGSIVSCSVVSIIVPTLAPVVVPVAVTVVIIPVVTIPAPATSAATATTALVLLLLLLLLLWPGIACIVVIASLAGGIILYRYSNKPNLQMQ